MTPYHQDEFVTLLHGDVLEMLAQLPEASVHCVVTSPPYWSKRNYHVDGQLGMEPTPEAYVAKMVEVFKAIRRVLRDDGVCWLNLGDSYAGSGSPGGDYRDGQGGDEYLRPYERNGGGLKPLDLCGIPERVVLALQADGWYWRSTVIWAKPNPMPESVNGWRWQRCRVKGKPSARADADSAHSVAYEDSPQGARDGREFANHDSEYADCPGCAKCQAHGGYVLRKGCWRPTTSHEYIFMLTKTDTYYANAEAVREPAIRPGDVQTFGGQKGRDYHPEPDDPNFRNGSEQWGRTIQSGLNGRNPRSVWSFPSEGMDLQRCAGCGKVHEAREFRRLPQVEVETLDAETGEMETRMVRRCKACGGTEWGSHYAGFPQRLPELCILASTSPRGVCPTCGAQYAPVVEASKEYQELLDSASSSWYASVNKDIRSGNNHPQAIPEIAVLGYLPTCPCPIEPLVPATVLDPFCGAGTTNIVARKLGRRSIGIDLSEPYLAIAVKRLSEFKHSQAEMQV